MGCNAPESPCKAADSRPSLAPGQAVSINVVNLRSLSVRTEFASGIMLTEVRVPKHTIKGHSVRLECHYDMEGEALYSVKWYKDGREFYRYVPRDDPPGTVFPQPGIIVDVSKH